jgi:small GTP-binding protein
MENDSNNLDQVDLSKVKDFFNIALIGDSSVGKTCILEKYVNNRFKTDSQNKKMIEIYQKKISFSENMYKLKFWDITKFIGKNDVSGLDMFYNCDAIIFVSSYDNKSSLDNINIWYQLLIEYIDLSTKEMIWLINKKDLEEGKILTEQQIYKKSKDLQLDFLEVSAKTGENIDEGIKDILYKLVQRCNDSLEQSDSSTADSLDNDLQLKKKISCNIF